MSVTDIARASGRDIEAITKDILENKRSGGKAVLAIGWGLVEAKEQLSHGEWLPWLAEQIGFSERQAQRFMRLAREYSNPTLVSDLGARKALALLALPEPEREEFVELRHVVDGAERSVADMSAAQLEQLIRERDEARQAQYQAEAERSLAETERDELSDQIKILTAANEQGQQAVMNALAQADQMERKIAELKARPVEVAVQVDQAAVDKARAEGEAVKAAEIAELQKKLDKEKEKARKLKADLDFAAQGRADAESALGEAQARLALAEKKSTPSPITADAELAQFSLLFEQAQGIVNQLRGLILKVRGREDATAAEKLAAALTALAKKIEEAAQ